MKKKNSQPVPQSLKSCYVLDCFLARNSDFLVSKIATSHEEKVHMTSVGRGGRHSNTSGYIRTKHKSKCGNEWTSEMSIGGLESGIHFFIWLWTRKCATILLTWLYSHELNVHAGVGTAAFVVAAVELPLPVKDRFKVLALHPRHQAITSTSWSPAKTH